MIQEKVSTGIGARASFTGIDATELGCSRNFIPFSLGSFHLGLFTTRIAAVLIADRYLGGIVTAPIKPDPEQIWTTPTSCSDRQQFERPHAHPGSCAQLC